MDAVSTGERKLVQYRDKSLLFDFDGTLSLGSGPVLAYARSAAAQLAPKDAEAFAHLIVSTLAVHPSGRAPGSDAIDGYDLVRLAAPEYGIRPETLGDAYLASREQLGSPLAPVVAPRGLSEFLRAARERANIVVATNAPDVRIAEALEILGIVGLVDAVYTSLGKPAGLDAVLDEWMPRGPVLSIGDVWVNDLAPAHARGALTALVGAPPHGSSAAGAPDATPTYQAEHLHELYPAMNEWLDARRHQTLHSSHSTTPTERQYP